MVVIGTNATVGLVWYVGNGIDVPRLIGLFE